MTVDLYWLPLGAGGRSVRFNGIVFEAVVAGIQRRERCDLYHSALQVDGYVIEMAPVWNDSSPDRGVVCEGAVGSRLLGGLRLFRYEVRCWREGRIPDVAEAVESPQRLSDDPVAARRILELVRECPAPVWSLRWNSNSLIAWLIAGSGIDPGLARLPTGGRAPGWDAGLPAQPSREAGEHTSGDQSGAIGYRRPAPRQQVAVLTRGSRRLATGRRTG